MQYDTIRYAGYTVYHRGLVYAVYSTVHSYLLCIPRVYHSACYNTITFTAFPLHFVRCLLAKHDNMDAEIAPIDRSRRATVSQVCCDTLTEHLCHLC